MTTKKILGFLFIIIAILLTLAIVGQLTKLLAAIGGLMKVFTGSLDSYQIGKVVGTIIYWIIHFTATVVLWRYGMKWIRKKKYHLDENNI